MTVRFHPDAEMEMVGAAKWYERQQEYLGKRFLSSVQDSVNRLLLDPRMFPVVESDVRRCMLKTFPYGLLFRIASDEIHIVAVMHLHRQPGYWRERLSEQ